MEQLHRSLRRLKPIIEGDDSKASDWFDLLIQSLIVVSLVSFAIETLPNLSETSRIWLSRTEVFCVAVFTAEYILRLLVADSKIRFATSFFGVIDLLAVGPFYFSAGMHLKTLRVFRLLRLFRIFKLVRYSKAIQRFHQAFLIAKEELVLYFVLTLLILFLASCGIHHFEHDAQPDKFPSIPHSLWWSVATLTTVGYGDVYPVTPGGKFFTFLVLLLGLGVVAVPAGLVSSALSKAREMEE